MDTEFILAAMCGIFSFIFYLKSIKDDEKKKVEKIKKDGSKIIEHGDKAARDLRSKLINNMRIEQDRKIEQHLYMPRRNEIFNMPD